jgi:hypothetical protein
MKMKMRNHTKIFMVQEIKMRHPNRVKAEEKPDSFKRLLKKAMA